MDLTLEAHAMSKEISVLSRVSPNIQNAADSEMLKQLAKMLLQGKPFQPPVRED